MKKLFLIRDEIDVSCLNGFIEESGEIIRIDTRSVNGYTLIYATDGKGTDARPSSPYSGMGYTGVDAGPR